MPRLRLLPAIALTLASTSLLQAKAQIPIANDEPVSRKLVLRLLNYPTGTVQQLLIGRLPNRLPVELPLPNKAKVVASVVREQELFDILLDVNQSPEQVQAFYRERLQAAGWQRRLMGFDDVKGFVPTDFGALLATSTFCKSSQGPLLSITANPVKSAPTNVTLSLRANYSNSGCDSAEVPISPAGPLPALFAPPNTRTSFGGGGGSNTDYYSSATLETQLNSQVLITNYEAQFKQAGWTQRDSGQSGGTTWTILTMKDKKGQSWQGMLSLTKIEGRSNQYFAFAMAIRL